MNEQELKKLKLLSANIRLDTLKCIKKCGYGHLGGSLSIVELLSVLYGKQLRYDAKNPQWEGRDFVILSKGHAGPGLYSALANVGFFSKDWLLTLNEGGTKLPSHLDRTKTPGVDMTAGSLGQGTSAAAGVAIGLKLKKAEIAGQARNDDTEKIAGHARNDDTIGQLVYVVVGDGELNEGQCWEAFQFIAHNKLNNCIVFIDENKKQLDGWTKDVINPFDIEKKMQAFGFFTQKVKANDEIAIDNAIEKCKSIKDSAVCIILDSIKGQGIKYFEDMIDNHSVKFNTPENLKAADEAIEELESIINRYN
ncbi:MAG: transketolase [Endomicrobium sp.]|jgi:transketolase|nr:transketolase [Endomicrobium sp.]